MARTIAQLRELTDTLREEFNEHWQAAYTAGDTQTLSELLDLARSFSSIGDPAYERAEELHGVL